MLTRCQQDASLRSGVFEVLRVETSGEGRWKAWLADSVLYPEGGGQPCDLGTVAGVPVLSVVRSDEGLLHELAGPVSVGEAQVEVDWARRFDHMQQHTGQHLLSALAQDRFGWATTSFHLNVGLDARCDVELDAKAIDLPALEEAINAEIRAARAVRAVLVDELPADVRSRGMPEGYRGPIRLVEIDTIDRNTCGGTHLQSTAELQAVALLGTERVRGGTRLFFVAGHRVLHHLHRAERVLAEAGGLLSRGPTDLVDGVRKLVEDGKAGARAHKLVLDELADALGAALAAQPGPVRAAHRGEGDITFLNRIATGVLARAPDAIVVLTAEPDTFLVAAPPEVLATHRSTVLEWFEAKGGGPPGRLQGKAARLDRRDEVVACFFRPH